MLDFQYLLSHLAWSDAGERAVLGGRGRLCAVIKSELSLVPKSEEVLLKRRLNGAIQHVLSSRCKARSRCRGLVLASGRGAAEASPVLLSGALFGALRRVAELQGAVVLDSERSRLRSNHAVYHFLGHAVLVDGLVPLNLALTCSTSTSDFDGIERSLLYLLVDGFELSKIELVG